MDLPCIPRSAWVAVIQSFDSSADLSESQASVFPVSRELWPFAMSTTLHSIWVERLRRMDESSLTQEVRTPRARTIFLQVVMRFRGSLYEPDMVEDGQLFSQVRSALADTLLCSDDSPALYILPIDRNPGVLYLLFFDRESRENPGPGGAGSVIVQLHSQKHAACFMCVSSVDSGSVGTTNNVAEYCGLVHGLRQAKTSG